MSGNGTSVTIDALGRKIDSGFLTATFYSPDGLLRVAYKTQVARLANLQLPGGGFATYDEGNGGLIEYNHSDNLGSARLTSNPFRAFVRSKAFAPFGEVYAATVSAGSYFTGQGNFFNLDTYEFPAREYVDQGLWASPDPAGLAAVDPAFPQSWNRYAYVMNNPLSLVDPTGMCGTDFTITQTVADDGSIATTATVTDSSPCPGLQPWLTITNFACLYYGTCHSGSGGTGNGGGGNSSGSSWLGTAVTTFFTVPYRKPGETFTACWNRAASDTLVGMGVPREATPGTEALLGSAGTVGLFSSVKSIWALGNWVRPSSYLAKITGGFGFGSAGAKAARLGGKALAVPIAAEVGLRTGAALDCAIPVGSAIPVN